MTEYATHHHTDTASESWAVRPGDARWDLARRAFNLALDQWPELVAEPRDAREVCEVVRFAAERGLRVAPQRTGHGAGPLGPLQDTVLLRTDRLHGVQIGASSGHARVLAGTQWQDVVPPAAAHGLTALHGTAADVGVVGYTLGGGLSWYGRKFGLASDQVLALDVVDADARLCRVDADSDPDLFWALRGGMGNFGVVTAIEFELLQIPEICAGALFFEFERAHEILQAWREWVETVPEEVTSVWRTLRFPPVDQVPEPLRGRAFAIIEAVIIGSPASGEVLVAPLRQLGPAVDTFAPSKSDAITGLHMDPPAPIPYSSTHHLLEDLAPATIERLLSVIGPGSESQLLSFEIRHLGGALARDSLERGALSGVPGMFSVVGGGLVSDASTKAALTEQYAGLREAVGGAEAGLTPNFTTSPTDASSFFPADVVDRLRRIRRARDPNNVFRAGLALN